MGTVEPENNGGCRHPGGSKGRRNGLCHVGRPPLADLPGFTVRSRDGTSRLLAWRGCERTIGSTADKPRGRRVEPTQGRVLLPQLRFDDLLAELQVRLAAVVKTRDRVRALLEAVVAVGSNLELEVVLRQIVEAAVPPVNPRCGPPRGAAARLRPAHVAARALFPP